MKTFKYTFAVAALSSTLIFTSCSEEGVAPLSNNTTPLHQHTAIDGISSGNENTLPIVTVIKNNFAGTTGWRITWKGGSYSSETVHNVQSIFSTITGAVNSVNFLNAVSWGNTNNADMQLFFGKLKATAEVTQLVNETALKQTLFRLSNWNVAMLEDAAKNNPINFAVGFELGFFGPKVTVTGNYSAGQIYLFKTDRPQPKYGAVRIVKYGGSESIIEVVVQK
jgi:hypothetical protein